MTLAARILTIVAFPGMLLLPFWYHEPPLILFSVVWLAVAAYGWAR